MEFGIFHEFFFDPVRVPGGGAQFDGVSAELNPGSMLSHEQVLSSLRLYCEEVMPSFK